MKITQFNREKCPDFYSVETNDGDDIFEFEFKNGQLFFYQVEGEPYSSVCAIPNKEQLDELIKKLTEMRERMEK